MKKLIEKSKAWLKTNGKRYLISTARVFFAGFLGYLASVGSVDPLNAKAAFWGAVIAGISALAKFAQEKWFPDPKRV